MTANRKSMIAMAALIAAGFVAATDLAQSRPQTSPAASVAARFPAATETMVAHNIGRAAQPELAATSPAKAGKLAPAACVHEHWPYIADECLVSNEGAEPRRPIRTIQIERHAAAKPQAAVR